MVLIPCFLSRRNTDWIFPLLLMNKNFTMFRRLAPSSSLDLGVRPTGYKRGDTFVEVPEMIPELVVPDLTGFKLKPYVSYRVQDVIQSEFTPKDLFDAVYSEKIVNDFKNGKLDESGEPLEPSPEEQLKPEEAFLQARKTGTDIFQ
ncbi:large ribosomal subunit protein mL41 isoform X2 [Periplaneta americana]|uniref:large ribosomal subunit protein mL41 isoform X2 n=1 Tax=Periplaneta americana TaxID=6978 RepID=UPI0037E72D66